VSYTPGIPVDPAYREMLGQAVYNFQYLEGIVMSTIGKLVPSATITPPTTAAKIARALLHAIEHTSPALHPELDRLLRQFHGRFSRAIVERNHLLQARPYTAAGGVQQLGGGGRWWSIDEVTEAARLFEKLAGFGSKVFHGELMKARP
jgi:hypothetical protein